MTHENVSPNDAVCFELDAKATIAEASTMHNALISQVADGTPLILDGGRVEQIDTAVLQLLVGLMRHCKEHDISCVWRAVSEPLRRAAFLIGVTAHLHIPDAPSTSPHGLVAA